MLRNIINKIYWSSRENVEIVFIHRGAPNDLKSISASLIVRVNPQSFDYKYNNSVVHIPFHRIVLIKDNKRNIILWKSKRHIFNM